MQQNNNLPFPLTLYRASCRGNVSNNNYPIVTAPIDALTLKSELSYDHTFIQFKGNHRSLDNFEGISVITVDCDNDHSENEDDWYTADDIHVKYSDVKHIIVTSRNHMKQKGNKSPRPRFHIIFWVGTTLYTPKEYTKLITRIQSDLPIYDSNALDAARFFFANPDTEVFVHDGTLSIMDYLDKQDEAEHAFANLGEHIAEGSRNTTMHQKAVCLLKRYGNTEESKTKYLQEADKCSPTNKIILISCRRTSQQSSKQVMPPPKKPLTKDLWNYKKIISKANNKEGYDTIADEIFRLRKLKHQSEIEGVTRDEHIKRISELHDFITQNPQTELTEFDKALVRRLLQKVTVYDDYYTVEFKSGVGVDVVE